MSAKIVHVETLGYLFKVVDPSTYSVGDYEFRDELEAKRRCWLDISPEETVVDVGASWGGYTMLALAQGARVIAVEPGTKSVDVLRRNVEANGWEERCTVVQALLGDGSALDDERYRRDMATYFGVPPEIGSMTLDSLVVELGLERLDRLKSDIEGAEVALLRGAKEALQRWRPKLLIEDHTNDKLPGMSEIRRDVLALLEEAGYDDVVCWTPEAGNAMICAGCGK